MKLKFWGVRGSWDKPYTTETLIEKEASLLHEISRDPRAMDFLRSCPNEESVKRFLQDYESLHNKVYGGNTTCFSLNIKDKLGQDKLVIIDAGSGITELGNYLIREKTMKKIPIEALILFTHVHGDHIEGYPFFGPAYDDRNSFTLAGLPNFVTTIAEEADRNSARVGTETRFRKQTELESLLNQLDLIRESVQMLVAKDGVKASGVDVNVKYNSGIELAMSGNTDRGRHPIPFELQRKIGANVTTIDLDLDNKTNFGLDMDCEQGNHPGGILMYKFRETKTLGITGDWEHGKLLANSRHRLYTLENTPSFYFLLVEFLAGCDVVVSDSQFSPAEYYNPDPKLSKATWGHPTDEAAIEVTYQAAQLADKQMFLYLFHHDPNHRDSWLDKRKVELQKFSQDKGFDKLVNFDYAREGMEVEI